MGVKEEEPLNKKEEELLNKGEGELLNKGKEELLNKEGELLAGFYPEEIEIEIEGDNSFIHHFIMK